MKANAPEKIYIPTILAANTVRYKEEGSIEYTRTDAFIEKAQMFLIDNLKELPIGDGKIKIKADCSLEDFIEEFKKAMSL